MTRAIAITETQVKMIVKETVKELFLNLGWDITDNDDVIEHQKDRHYLRIERTRKEALTTKSVQHIVNLCLGAVGAVLVLWLTGYRG